MAVFAPAKVVFGLPGAKSGMFAPVGPVFDLTEVVSCLPGKVLPVLL